MYSFTYDSDNGKRFTAIKAARIINNTSITLAEATFDSCQISLTMKVEFEVDNPGNQLNTAEYILEIFAGKDSSKTTKYRIEEAAALFNEACRKYDRMQP